MEHFEHSDNTDTVKSEERDHELLRAEIWRLVRELDAAREKAGATADPWSLAYQAFLEHVDEAGRALQEYEYTMLSLRRSAVAEAPKRPWWSTLARKVA